MRLNELRKERGMSLYKLAELCDVTVPYLSELSHGRKTPSVSIAFRIAKALDTTIEYLMGYTYQNVGDELVELKRENKMLKRKLGQIKHVLQGLEGGITNIPTRGFAVSKDIEDITREAYNDTGDL